MRKLFFFSLFSILFSCGEKSSQELGSGNILENLTFTSDTVLVDSGEEIINLSMGLRLADISPDRKTLFLLDMTDHQLSVIDLNQLRLEKKIPFEPEGPNGIGNYMNKIQLLPNGRILFASFEANAVFNTDGRKEMDIEFLPEKIDSLSEVEQSNAWYGLMISSDGRNIFSLPGNFFEGGRDLLVADFPSLKGKIIDIPAMDIASELRVVLSSKDMMSVSIQEVNLQELGKKVVVGNSASSDIYIYDPKNDSLELKMYQHSLVPNRKEVSVRSEVESQEEFQAENEKINQQIGFQRFFEDPESKLFFRFGSISLPKSNPDAERRSEVYLFAYDEELNLVGEARLEKLTKVPSNPFFKDGKLWSYVNVDDELGFAVMDLNLNLKNGGGRNPSERELIINN
ncbi:DUF4221 family protein [Algoriphagus taiwanensis]|uniref:DUF4221 domain-containing protein n=1 Tax=Algoriphagus taiwanensis TaxID=1445656 RepID=A0ABQ6Q306_9BACT|nr:hypothetical protein Ataiwa_21350 [Algoriphagus taiwanensis]